MIYYIEYKCYTDYHCSKVHCKLSLVADALRITVCARERDNDDIAFMRHSNQKENKYIQGSKRNKS